MKRTSVRKERERGQGMTEYIIIVALIAIAAITVVGGFGGVVKTQFSRMAGALAGKPVSADPGTHVRETDGNNPSMSGFTK